MNKDREQFSDDDATWPDSEEYGGDEIDFSTNLSDADGACLVLSDLDYDLQLRAIRGLLTRQDKADEELVAKIDAVKKLAAQGSGILNQHADEAWVGYMYDSVYQDAAHSMAAIGMIAPFIESVFYQAFQNIGHEMTKDISPPNNHARWQRPAQDQWDCHFVWVNGRRKDDLVRGIIQLIDAIGMTSYMPDDLKPTLSALFEYRNKMFHCGFEWPLEERRRFDKRLNESGWPPDWFSKATSDGEPWIFYMSSVFIEHCLVRADQIITGIGGFCNNRLHNTSLKDRKETLVAVDERQRRLPPC